MRTAPLIVCVISLLIAGSIVIRMGTDDSGSTAGPVAVPDPPELADGPQPKVEFDSTEHDFGEMYQGQTGTHVFNVTNTGEGLLELVVGRSTCSCTIGELEKPQLAPGESTTITLNWTIKNAAPAFEHSAEIQTNVEDDESIRLIVKGRVIFGLVMLPQMDLDFGLVQYDETSTVTASVLSDIREDLEVSVVDTGHPWTSAELRKMSPEELDRRAEQIAGPPADPDKPDASKPALQSGFILELTVAPRVERGRFVGELTLKTNIEGREELTVRYTGQYPGPLQFVPLPGTQYFAEPMVIGGGSFKAAEGKTVELLMFVRGLSEELEVSEITTEPKWLKASLTPEQGSTTGKVQRFRLKIEVPPNLPAVVRGRENPAVLKMTTNHPGLNDLKLDFSFTSL